jgi:Domain of unknown function (DUF4115)
METLLIVLVIGCALAFVIQVGRGIWARTRTVVHHQQALDTLAELTQRPENADDPQGPSEHQAHVRLIGPGSQYPGDNAALPPPRALPSSASPFRHPSRTPPPAAPIEAMGASASLSGPDTAPLTRSSSPPPPMHLPPPPQFAQETMPGLPPPPAYAAEPEVFVEPPTVPVPIVQPQVFYFDDLSSRAEVPDHLARKPRRLSRRRRRNDTTAEHVLPVLPPPPVFASPDKVPAHGGGGDGGRKSVVGLVLAAAAICVAVVAIGVTVVGLPGQGSPGVPAAARSSAPTTAHPHTTTTSAPARTTTTTSPPVKPAVLVSSQNGTATYQLRSASASIVVTASGPCWLEVRANSPLGQIVYEGTLEAGGRSTVTGPAWIRLGNPPVVAVKVNGTPMTVPGAQVGLPLNLQFTFG